MHYILIKKIKIWDFTRKKNNERIRYWFSKKLNLEFAGNLTSHYLPLIVMLFVMLLYHYTQLSYRHGSSGQSVITLDPQARN